MKSIILKKDFWISNLFLFLGIIFLVIFSFLSFLILMINATEVYPLFESIISSGNIDSLLKDPFFVSNMHMFNTFFVKATIILVFYTIFASGILSFFEYLILKKILKKNFILKDWLKLWFDYSCIGLLFLIIVSFALLKLNNIIILSLLLFLIFFVYIFLLYLINFRLFYDTFYKKIHFYIKRIIVVLLILFFVLIIYLIFFIFLIYFLKIIGLIFGLIVLLTIINYFKFKIFAV